MKHAKKSVLKILLAIASLVLICELFIYASEIIAGFDVFMPKDITSVVYWLFVFVFPLCFFGSTEFLFLKKGFSVQHLRTYLIYFALFICFVVSTQMIIRKYLPSLELEDSGITWGIDRIKHWYFVLYIYVWFFGSKIILYFGRYLRENNPI